MVVEAGMNGHEWVSTVFVTYLIAKLIHARESGSASWRALSKKYNWYMIPVANPDGFAYTYTEVKFFFTFCFLCIRLNILCQNLC